MEAAEIRGAHWLLNRAHQASQAQPGDHNNHNAASDQPTKNARDDPDAAAPMVPWAETLTCTTCGQALHQLRLLLVLVLGRAQVSVLVQVPVLVVEVVVGGERQQIVVERQFSALAIKSFWRHTSLLWQNKEFWRKGLKRGVWGVLCGNIYPRGPQLCVIGLAQIRNRIVR